VTDRITALCPLDLLCPWPRGNWPERVSGRLGRIPSLPSVESHRTDRSHGKDLDLCGARGDLRSAGEQRRDLAGPPEQAAHSALVRPIHRRQSRAAARGGWTCDVLATSLGVRRHDANLIADRNEPAVSRAHFLSQSCNALIVSS